MLEKGDCKVPGHTHNKLFRRRFNVPFLMSKDVVEEARECLGPNGTKLGDVAVDCRGVLRVPEYL